MHTTFKQYPGFNSTTNYEGDDVKSRDGDCADGGDGEDGDKDGPPYAKEGLMVMMATISPFRRQPGDRIWPLPRWKKVSASASEKYGKIMA